MQKEEKWRKRDSYILYFLKSSIRWNNRKRSDFNFQKLKNDDSQFFVSAFMMRIILFLTIINFLRLIVTLRWSCCFFEDFQCVRGINFTFMNKLRIIQWHVRQHLIKLLFSVDFIHVLTCNSISFCSIADYPSAILRDKS